MTTKNPTPWRVERVEPKGRSALHLNIVDADGGHVIGGFGYFYEEKLQRICDGVNAAEVVGIGSIMRTIRAQAKRKNAHT